jgi:hypothetical protein
MQMDLEPDTCRLAQLASSQREERSGLWWVTVIMIGVLFGNLLSFGAYQLYVKWELQQLAIALKKEAAEFSATSKAEMEQLAKQHEATRREREKQQAMQSKLLQTCNFWRQQVAKENTAQNRAYRDAACARAATPG